MSLMTSRWSISNFIYPNVRTLGRESILDPMCQLGDTILNIESAIHDTGDRSDEVVSRPHTMILEVLLTESLKLNIHRKDMRYPTAVSSFADTTTSDWIIDRRNLDLKLFIAYTDNWPSYRRQSVSLGMNVIVFSFCSNFCVIQCFLYPCASPNGRSSRVEELKKGRNTREEDCVVATSRLARNLVSVTLHTSPTMSSSSSIPSREHLTRNSSTLDSLSTVYLVI